MQILFSVYATTSRWLSSKQENSQMFSGQERKREPHQKTRSTFFPALKHGPFFFTGGGGGVLGGTRPKDTAAPVFVSPLSSPAHKELLPFA